MKIQVKVITNAKKDEIIPGSPLIIKTKKPPLHGKANQAVIKSLTAHFHKPVKIISGHKSKYKQIEIQNTHHNSPKNPAKKQIKTH